MLSFTGCVVILFGLVELYGYNSAVRNFYEMEIYKFYFGEMQINFDLDG